METKVSHYNKKNRSKEKDELVIKTAKDEANEPSWLTKIFFLIGLGLIILALLIFAWVDFSRRPVSGEKGEPKYFEVKKGEPSRQIAANLEKEGLVRSKYVFLVFAKSEMGKSLQAGYYKLSPSMSTNEIIKRIQKGEIDAYSITVPEGYRVLQIAKILSEKAGIDQSKFIEAATGTEGTLFPDTYLFPVNYEPSKIVRAMREDFETRTAKYDLSPEALILASIVEREAKADDERAKIAAVYKNRADKNMLFQADPAVRYALDSQYYLKNKTVDFQFWKGITKDDCQNLNSPFNVYKQKGFPPAPICNPGLKSIEAAVNPEKDFDSLFFFHDKNGQIHFSKTLPEHQESIKKFGVSGQ